MPGPGAVVPWLLAVALTCTGLVGAAVAAESDLAVQLNGPTMVVVPHDRAMTFNVAYRNGGPQRASDVVLEVRFPPAVPAPFDRITVAELDAIRASLADDQGNLPLLFATPGCDALMVTLQGPDGPSPAPLSLEPDDGGVLTITTPVPAVFPMAVGLEIHSPPSVAGVVTELGRGSCASCDDVPGSCFGEPLALFDLGAYELVLADDGGPEPTLACSALNDAVRDKVVLVDRGECEFGVKAFVAEEAGAVGVIIANDGTCGDGSTSEDCVVSLEPGELGTLTSIPVVMVSQRIGDALRAELDAGRYVMLTLGGRDDWVMTFEAAIASIDPDHVDPDPGNDRSTLATEYQIIDPPPLRRWRRGGGRLGSPWHRAPHQPSGVSLSY